MGLCLLWSLLVVCALSPFCLCFFNSHFKSFTGLRLSSSGALCSVICYTRGGVISKLHQEVQLN
jgi:hypothetical protein